jgi:hypothetical protein
MEPMCSEIPFFSSLQSDGVLLPGGKTTTNMEKIYISSCSLLEHPSNDTLVLYGLDERGLRVLIDITDPIWTLYLRPSDCLRCEGGLRDISNNIHFEETCKYILGDSGNVCKDLVKLTIASLAIHRQVMSFLKQREIRVFTDQCSILPCHSGALANNSFLGVYTYYSLSNDLLITDTTNPNDFPCGNLRIQRYVKTVAKAFKKLSSSGQPPKQKLGLLTAAFRSSTQGEGRFYLESVSLRSDVGRTILFKNEKERQLLETLALHVREENMDFLLCNVDREFIPLCKCFVQHQLFDELNSLLSIDPRVKPQIREKKSNSYVKGFGVAVLDCPPEIDCGIETLENFVEMVRQAGANAVASARDGGMSVLPSVVYNINYARTLRQLGMVTEMEKKVENSPVKGGLVLDPVPCYTADPVFVLDFASMYPSIVQTFNICKSSRLGALSTDACFEVGSWRLALQQDRRGILPILVDKWLNVRQEAKQEKSPSRERAAKTCLVSLVGQNMSSKMDNPFCSSELANVITAIGRSLLEALCDKTPDFAHPLMDGPPIVLYGVSKFPSLLLYNFDIYFQYFIQ